MSPMIKVSLFACVLLQCGGLVPSIPCSDLFNESQPSGVIATTFRNNMKVNTSQAGMIKTFSTKLVKGEYNIQQGGNIAFEMGFSHNLSKLIWAKFGGQILCSEPHEVATKDQEVIVLSNSIPLRTTIIEDVFTIPNPSNKTTIIEDVFTIPNPSTTTTTPAPSTQTVEIKIRDEDQCGINIEYKPLVIRGNPTRSEEYPWLVAIFETAEGYRFICGGSLVSKRHVITAAHCIYGTDKSKDDFIVVLGKHNIKNWARGATIRALKDYYVHPEYKHPADADIAVLLLDEPVTYSGKLRAICMWDESDSLSRIAGSRGTVAGWGKDENGLEWVEEPKQIELPIVSQETCLWSNERFVKITSNRTFCAGNLNKVRGPCTGDSGGGFVMKRDGIWKLRGIVSVALMTPSRTCDVNSYIVFSDVPKYAGWLKEIMAHL